MLSGAFGQHPNQSPESMRHSRRVAHLPYYQALFRWRGMDLNHQPRAYEDFTAEVAVPYWSWLFTSKGHVTAGIP